HRDGIGDGLAKGSFGLVGGLFYGDLGAVRQGYGSRGGQGEGHPMALAVALRAGTAVLAPDLHLVDEGPRKVGVFNFIVNTIGLRCTCTNLTVIEVSPVVVASLAVPELHITQLLIVVVRSEEHTSELQSRENLVCRLLLE